MPAATPSDREACFADVDSSPPDSEAACHRIRFQTHSEGRDELTGVGRRRQLLERLATELELTHRRGRPGAALLVFGLDRFCAINASLGYATGDRVLIEAARRIALAARPGDLVARLDGDVLAILAGGLSGVTRARRLATEALERLRWPMRFDDCRVAVTASAGIAWIDDHYTHPDQILRDAEIALKRAKANGPARSVLFDAAEDGADVARFLIETDLRGALERGELRLHYQPIIELATGRLRAFEALARWQHPRRGLLRPRDFLHCACGLGLMPALSTWTLTEACRQLAEWRSRLAGGPRFTMSVNLDAQLLTDPTFVSRLDRILRRFELSPGDLDLEITETAMMSTAARSAAILQELADRGFALSIDDFGTGYATLSYLHRVPGRAVKIDASFVTEMLSDDRHRQIVRSIVELAHNLQLEVIAEGIETPPHLESLRRLGCDYGQGFYFSRPLAPAALEPFLAGDARWADDLPDG